MSTGQWEVVGKSKKNKPIVQNGKKTTKADKNKLIDNSPKIEDILPLAQVKSLYSPGKSNKENKKPLEKTKEKDQPKKQPKKQESKKPEQKSVSKPKPKSIESALSSMNVEELKSILELGKQRFPDAKLVWLKDIAAYINMNTAVDGIDPVFAGKPDNYPLNIVPNALRQVLENTLKDTGLKITQLFFDVCLLSMANDMSKGASVIGYKIFIQMIVFRTPSIVVTSLTKSASVRDSYQNRQQVGLSILWALGLAGQKDFSVGLKVFREIMLPMIEMKNYSRYIVSYLKQLMAHCPPGALSSDQYISLFDVINGSKLNLPKELMKEMAALNSQLKSKLLDKRSDGKFHLLYDPLFKRLNTVQNNEVKRDILNILIQCLVRESQPSMNTWKQLYPKNVSQSAQLLAQINNSWNRLNSQLDKKQFKELVKTFHSHNSTLSQGKRKEEGLQEATRACKALIEKMTITKAFPWKSLTFLIISSTVGLLAFDSIKHGGFASSTTGRFLKDVGAWEYGEMAIEQGKIYGTHAKVWLEENGPIYYAATKEYLTPYAELARDMTIISFNTLVGVKDYVFAKIPVVLATVEQYAPGLVDKVTTVSVNAWSTVSYYTLYYYTITREYLATNVFVGQLSPENLQRATLEALNTTQIYAAQYYDWVYQKVQLLANSKVQ